MSYMGYHGLGSNGSSREALIAQLQAAEQTFAQYEALQAQYENIEKKDPIRDYNIARQMNELGREINNLKAAIAAAPSSVQPTIPVVSPPVPTTTQVPITPTGPIGVVLPVVKPVIDVLPAPLTAPTNVPIIPPWQGPTIINEPVPVVSPPVTTTTQVPTEPAPVSDNTWLYIGGAILALLLLGGRRTA